MPTLMLGSCVTGEKIVLHQEVQQVLAITVPFSDSKTTYMTATAALKGPFVGQRGAQYQIFKWPPDYLYIVLVLVGVE